ncbi:MAG: endolytic transglycosylase MltG [Ignavibacteriales bacterium]|nr:endolytic transglycosylase MltG [Ignavibacteriales bacterium]MBK7266901.1 endolytic transglycosylase MltG [Ignavibacteriales bacterium]MBP7543834.1 endolytic transglycosylase MltG [Ignavibacteriaceae bacterium]MBP9122801.1 endolytic transglycosylase MltG [Ignavibacteriaceae bacterium]
MENKKFKFSQLLTKRQFMVVGATFVIALSLLIYLFFTPFGSSSEKVRYVIPTGTSFSKVVSDLKVLGVVGNETLAKIAGMIYGLDKRLKPGLFFLPKSVSYTELMEILSSDDHEKPVTFELYNGITINGIANRAKQIKLKAADSLAILLRDTVYAKALGVEKGNFEGYLLPVNLQVFMSSYATEIIQQLFQEQRKVLSGKVMEDINKGEYTIHEILTLASIISRESKYSDEMPRVSGVYHNRLKKGMKLQADPTVQYALPALKNRITNADLKIDSPYNTYKYAGLPPGPIGNPGKDAILAAVYPESHKYLFFVAGKEGRHLFSENYTQHQIYAREYHKWLDSLKITQ